MRGRKRIQNKVSYKISPGTFADDLFERGTIIVQVDDEPVYKVGRGAKESPDLETSKKSEIHRVTTLAGVALACGTGVHDNVYVAIGIPLQICDIPEDRIEYKRFILGEEKKPHTVKLKITPDGEILTSTFTFTKEYVYPEGMGVLYEYPAELNGPTGIIDIGNLNTNNIYTDAFQINDEACFTDEMGGKILFSNLATVLSTELGSRCDENLVASTLVKPLEERYLRSAKGDKEIEEKSRDIINKQLKEHVLAIKRKCDTRHWPIDFMRMVCLGGTARILEHELRQVFGQDVFIPNEPEYVNVCGFLKKMCASNQVEVN